MSPAEAVCQDCHRDVDGSLGEVAEWAEDHELDEPGHRVRIEPATDGGRDYAWVVTCPHDERTIVEDDLEAAAMDEWEYYDVTIAGWSDGAEPRGVVADGGAPGGAAAPPEEPDESPWDERIHAEEDLYRDAEAEWGMDAQMAKAAEEFAELSAVCARDLNRQASGQVLLEELVDARIMLEQVAYQIDDDRLEETVEAKLAQLHARLAGGAGDE